MPGPAHEPRPPAARARCDHRRGLGPVCAPDDGARVRGFRPVVLDAARPRRRRALVPVLWFVADTNEAQFYASMFGGVALVGARSLAQRLDQRTLAMARLRHRGRHRAVAAVLPPRCSASRSPSVLYGRLDNGEWIPTFVPFVSIPAGVVLVYGGGWRNVLTGGDPGRGHRVPDRLRRDQACAGADQLPAVIGNVTGMWLGGIIVFEFCHRGAAMDAGAAHARGDRGHRTADREPRKRPWPSRSTARAGWPAARSPTSPRPSSTATRSRRPALLAGVILSWLLDSSEAVYGTGLLPSVIVGQVMVSALGHRALSRPVAQAGVVPDVRAAGERCPGGRADLRRRSGADLRWRYARRAPGAADSANSASSGSPVTGIRSWPTPSRWRSRPRSRSPCCFRFPGFDLPS